jgi:hypothetical protein
MIITIILLLSGSLLYILLKPPIDFEEIPSERMLQPELEMTLRYPDQAGAKPNV